MRAAKTALILMQERTTMKNEHKTAFQKDMVQKLRYENMRLKEELFAMEERNKELSKENAKLVTAADVMRESHDEIAAEYADAIAQAKKAKEEYEQVLSEIRLLKYNYEKQISELVQRIRDRR